MLAVYFVIIKQKSILLVTKTILTVVTVIYNNDIIVTILIGDRFLKLEL